MHQFSVINYFTEFAREYCALARDARARLDNVNLNCVFQGLSISLEYYRMVYIRLSNWYVYFGNEPDGRGTCLSNGVLNYRGGYCLTIIL